MTVRDNVPAAPSDTSVKAEPAEPEEKPSDGSSPQPPPVTVPLKTEVKKEEPEQENPKGNNEEIDMDGPCTKMTMRLRRNLNNPQCVRRSPSYLTILLLMNPPGKIG